MKSLEAFWHWVDNEKPAVGVYAEKAHANLSPLAIEALMAAERLVALRTGYEWRPTVGLWDDLDEETVKSFWPAMRDLSLAFAAGLARMHEQVEDGCLAREGADDITTFADVDSGRYLGTLADAKPQPLIRTCPACNSTPCDGTHPNCDIKAYLAAHPERAPWAAAKLADLKPFTVLGRAAPCASGDYTYRCEYQGEWLTEQQLAANALGPVIKVEAVERTNHYQGRIEIFTTVTPEEIDRLGGYDRVHTIVLRGRPEDYSASIRYRIAHVLDAYIDCAIVRTPESQVSLSAWGLARR